MADKSRARSEQGNGLGLALASRIARLHGATLQFESEMGKGTTVTIRFTSPKQVCEKPDECLPSSGKEKGAWFRAETHLKTPRLAALFSLMLVLSCRLGPVGSSWALRCRRRSSVPRSALRRSTPSPASFPAQPTPVEARPTVTQETGRNQPFPIASPAPAALPIQHHTGDSSPPKPPDLRI